MQKNCTLHVNHREQTKNENENHDSSVRNPHLISTKLHLLSLALSCKLINQIYFNFYENCLENRANDTFSDHQMNLNFFKNCLENSFADTFSRWFCKSLVKHDGQDEDETYISHFLSVVKIFR